MKQLLILLLLLPCAAYAASTDFTLVIKEHRFQPSELNVPAGERVKLLIENQDVTPEEFESFPLNREKVIPGNSSATIYIGPLTPGRYPFFGEFNESTAHGAIVAK
jgi:hypothetical protein